MVISEKGLCNAMNDAFKKKSTGYKVAARTEAGEEEIVLSAPGWTAIITRKNVPRKVLALIVEHVGDLPRDGEAFQVQAGTTQAEIYTMAVADQGNPVAGAVVKRTSLNYNGYQIWQRTDDRKVYMMDPKSEGMLDNFSRQVLLMESGMFRATGTVSKLYITPCKVMQNDMIALYHLAKLQWV